MSKTKYNVSVVIPMYNSEKTILNTINSIIAQTAYNNIKEIIVVNDGSSDKSREIVEQAMEMNNKIKLINKTNKGVSSSRNIGMKNSTGNWIAFCDSDDIWEKNKLQRQIDILNDNPKIDFLGSKWLNKDLRIFFRSINKLYKATLKDICITFFPQPSTVIMKKEIFDEIGGFDENQRYAEEGEYFFKICENYNYYFLPELLIKYDSTSIGLSANIKCMYKGNIKNIKELKNRKSISIQFYYFLRFYYWIKYIRRIILKNLK